MQRVNLFLPVFLATRFMAYHTPLSNSQEFTAALLKARELAHNITMGMRQIPGTSPDFEVFPYTYVHLLLTTITTIASTTPWALFLIYMVICHHTKWSLSLPTDIPLPFFSQGDQCVLWAVPDYCAGGTLHHLLVSNADLRRMLSAAGFGSALWSAQPVHHNHDHRGHRWCHDTVGHRLQRSGPHQSGHGKDMSGMEIQEAAWLYLMWEALLIQWGLSLASPERALSKKINICHVDGVTLN